MEGAGEAGITVDDVRVAAHTPGPLMMPSRSIGMRNGCLEPVCQCRRAAGQAGLIAVSVSKRP